MKRLVRVFGLPVASILSGLVIVEIILRLGFPEYSPAMKEISVPHPVYGAYLAPGRRSLRTGYGFRAYIETNSAGFREREFTPRLPGKKRIMFLGDSFTEGEQVEATKTFPRLVETLLNRDTDAYQCFNLAIHGFGTGQEYLVCRDFIDTIGPDVVVLGFFANNDVWDNSYRINHKYEYQVQTNRPLWKMNGDTMVMIQNDYDALMRNLREKKRSESLWHKSYLRNFCYDIKYRIKYNFLGRNKVNPATLNHLVYDKNYDENWDEAWEITRRLILMMRDIVAERGSRFLVVYIPDQVEIYDDRLKETIEVNPHLKRDELDLNKPWNILRPFLAANRIEHIDLRDRFRADPRRLYFKYDAHFNEDGHRAAAESIAGRLKKSGN